ADDPLEWCFAWAERHLKALPDENLELLRKNLADGILLLTRFSGLDAPGAAAREIERAVGIHGPDAGFMMHSAAERDARGLRCLRALAEQAAWRKHAPCHIFNDLESFVSKDVLEKMKKIAASKGDFDGSDEKEGAAFLIELMKPMFEGGESEKPSVAPCEVHGQGCNVVPEFGSKLALEITGSPCVDWSKRGRRRRAGGPTMIVYAVWLGSFIKSGLHVLVHENTPDFKDYCLLAPLHYWSSRHWKMEVFRVCPSQLGIPGRRARRFSVLWNPLHVTFAGSFKEFVQLFVTPTEYSGKIFFVSGGDLAVTASKTKLQSRQVYTDLFNERCRANVANAKASICDLTQRPPFGKLDELLPTLVTNHAPYCVECRRLLTPDESLMSQLLPADHPARQMLKDDVIKESH
ncbi:unnamed protein product, partial [Symbiodinium necroappetens]